MQNIFMKKFYSPLSKQENFNKLRHAVFFKKKFLNINFLKNLNTDISDNFLYFLWLIINSFQDSFGKMTAQQIKTFPIFKKVIDKELLCQALKCYQVIIIQTIGLHMIETKWTVPKQTGGHF